MKILMVIDSLDKGGKERRTTEHRSVCIYNGLDFARFENLRNEKEVRRDLIGERADRLFIVAMVASFDERKDFETLVKAAVKMCTINSSLIFLLIGSGPMLD